MKRGRELLQDRESAKSIMSSSVVQRKSQERARLKEPGLLYYLSKFNIMMMKKNTTTNQSLTQFPFWKKSILCLKKESRDSRLELQPRSTDSQDRKTRSVNLPKVS